MARIDDLISKLLENFASILTAEQLAQFSANLAPGGTPYQYLLSICEEIDEAWTCVPWNPTPGLPVGPSVGDTYLSLATARGWTINHIYRWNGSTWADMGAAGPRDVPILAADPSPTPGYFRLFGTPGVEDAIFVMTPTQGKKAFMLGDVA